MASVAPVLLGLLEDAGVTDHGDARRAVREHREHWTASWGPLLGLLLVPDRSLAEVGRCAGDQVPLSVCVRNTSGAGGLLALAQRQLDGLRLVAVESALRDLDDLSQNAARVVAATRELDPEVAVYVEVPYASGWERAVSAVEEAGLCCAVAVSENSRPVPPAQLAEQLRVLIEADVAFKTTGGGRPVPQLLRAVEVLIDGATPKDATNVLTDTDPHQADQVARWDPSTAARVRRRLRLVSCPSVADDVSGLVDSGLLSPV